MNALESQVALVTGATRGVGKAIAHRLASLGAHVLLVARNRDQLNQVCDQIAKAGGAASVFPCDLMSVSAVAQLGEAVAQNFKRCDVLVNDAGVGIDGKLLHEVNPRRVGSRFQYQLARSLPDDPRPRTSDDLCAFRPHHQYLVTGRTQPSPDGRSVRSIQMGPEWPQLLSGRRATSLQCPRQRRISRLYQYGLHRPRWQRRCIG